MHGDEAGVPSDYLNPREIERAREGLRFSATLRDGTPVIATILGTDLVQRLADGNAFVADLRGARDRYQHPAFPTPVLVGRTTDGAIHFAINRSSSWQPVAIGMAAPDAARLGAQLSQALHQLHAAGVTHGAISTSRIVLAADGPCIEGLGLLHALEAGGLTPVQAAMVLSPPGFIAAEAQTSGVIDARSDEFSLGAALYELLTGKPPFGGRTTSYVMATVLSGEGNAPPGKVEDPVISAVLRAIERAPDDRWPSALVFAQALSAAAGEPLEQSSKSRRGCLPFAATLALLLAGSAGIAVGLR